MAVAFKAAGAWTSAGAGSIAIQWPTHAAGDFGLLLIETYQTSNIATPAGWTPLTGSPLTLGTSKFYAFYMFAASASDPAVSISGYNNHAMGQILVYSGVDSASPINAIASGTQSLTSTQTVINLSAVTPTVAGCQILYLVCEDSQTASSNYWAGWTNAKLTGLTERVDTADSINNGGGIAVADGTMATAATTGAGSVTQQASGAVSTMHWTVALKPASGGGGGDTTPPTINTAATASVMENRALSIALTANETVTWSIVGGADQAQFEIAGSTLRWVGNKQQDYEAPADSDANNTYVVTVRATDTSNNTTDKTITVTVTNDTSDDAPAGSNPVPTYKTFAWATAAAVTTASFTVPSGDLIVVATGNQAGAAASTPGPATISDSRGLTWTNVASYADAPSSGNKGRIDVWVAVSDGLARTVTVGLGNPAPNGAIGVHVFGVSGASNVVSNTGTGEALTVPLTVTLASIPATTSTVIGVAQGSGTGLLAVPNSFTELHQDYDRTDLGDHPLQVVYCSHNPPRNANWGSLKPGGTDATNPFAVLLEFVAGTAGPPDTTPPTINTSGTQTIMENTVLSVGLTADEGVTWSLAGGADQAQFQISGSTLQWATNKKQDYEAPADSDKNNVYEVIVRATDGAGNHTDKVINVTVTNDSSDDPISGFTVYLNGSWIVKPVKWWNGTAWVTKKLKYFDGGAWQAAGIVVPPDTTAPTINTSASQSIMENKVLAISLTASEIVTWSIVGGTDSTKFELYNGSTLRWKSNGMADYEAPTDSDKNNTYQVIVRATDQAGNVTDKTITVTVTNDTADDPDTTAPTITSAASVSNKENTTLSFLLSANETVTWSIVGGLDQAQFQIGGANSNRLQWKSNGTKDYENPTDNGANNVYNVTVRATDTAGNYTNQAITVTVTNDTTDDVKAATYTPVAGTYSKSDNGVGVEVDYNVTASRSVTWTYTQQTLSGFGAATADVASGSAATQINFALSPLPNTNHSVKITLTADDGVAAQTWTITLTCSPSGSVTTVSTTNQLPVSQIP